MCSKKQIEYVYTKEDQKNRILVKYKAFSPQYTTWAKKNQIKVNHQKITYEKPTPIEILEKKEKFKCRFYLVKWSNELFGTTYESRMYLRNEFPELLKNFEESEKNLEFSSPKPKFQLKQYFETKEIKKFKVPTQSASEYLEKTLGNEEVKTKRYELLPSNPLESFSFLENINLNKTYQKEFLKHLQQAQPFRNLNLNQPVKSETSEDSRTQESKALSSLRKVLLDFNKHPYEKRKKLLESYGVKPFHDWSLKDDLDLLEKAAKSLQKQTQLNESKPKLLDFINCRAYYLLFVITKHLHN